MLQKRRRFASGRSSNSSHCSQMCPDSVEILCSKKMCKAVIILSAGFHEDGPEGSILEEKIVEIVNRNGASLIGPNCIGVMTPNYTGIFTKPTPPLSENGIDLISGSGATVVFILETALQLGVRVSSIFSVGNSAQTGIEDVLEYLDETYIIRKALLLSFFILRASAIQRNC